MLKLSVTASDLQNEGVQSLTQDICNTLNQEAGIPANIESGSSKAGSKGDPITIGVIALSFITSGAAVALFNTVSAYFARSKKIQFTVTKSNGESISLTSENVTVEEREKTLKQLRKFLED